MAKRNVILITGATGAQGGSVAAHLLKGGTFAVRALTRNPQSDRARGLAREGAEVVAGDLADRASVERALAGCHGCFGVTNFWEHFGKEAEHGRNLVEAVAASGVRHFVFSTLPAVKKITGGELDVPHFDIKGELEEHARVRELPATFVHIAFYYENFLTFFPPQKQEDGSYSFGFPQGDTPLAMVSVEDVGGIVAPVFTRREEFLGRTIGIVGDDRPCAEYASDMSRVLGKTIRYQHIPREVFAGFGFPGADDLANMFEFNRTRIPNRNADLEESRKLYAQIRTFYTWLEQNRARFENVLI